MTKTTSVNCPKCGRLARFKYEFFLSEKDALMLICLDGYCCRGCGTRLVKLAEYIEEEDD